VESALKRCLKNMGDDSSPKERASSGRLLIPSLFFSYFASGPLSVLVTLFLIDIGNTFKVSVGVMGQINTAYSLVAVVFGLLMGVLSIRFRHKSLLLLGLISISVSALGCFFALDFNFMLLAYSLSGLGWAMVSPMTSTLIGEFVPLEKRANAVGWVIAGGSAAYVVGAPAIALIAGFGGWRFPLLWFVVPVLLGSLVLAFVGLPSTSPSQQTTTGKEAYFESYKEVLSNRSATACLLGDILRSAAFTAILAYAISFFRQRFELSTDIASIIFLAAASCYTFGSVFSGRLVNRIGRKPSTTLTALLASLFTISYAYVPNLWLSLALNFLAAWFYGMVASASNSLTLEQVPRCRGTMMSIDSVALNLGAALGAAIGGVTLLSFDYEGLGTVLGTMGIIAAIVFYLLTTDPTCTKVPS
jgi:predicted MFS family arabinose efflux permease